MLSTNWNIFKMAFKACCQLTETLSWWLFKACRQLTETFSCWYFICQKSLFQSNLASLNAFLTKVNKVVKNVPCDREVVGSTPTSYKTKASLWEVLSFLCISFISLKSGGDLINIFSSVNHATLDFEQADWVRNVTRLIVANRRAQNLE